MGSDALNEVGNDQNERNFKVFLNFFFESFKPAFEIYKFVVAFELFFLTTQFFKYFLIFLSFATYTHTCDHFCGQETFMWSTFKACQLN